MRQAAEVFLAGAREQKGWERLAGEAGDLPTQAPTTRTRVLDAGSWRGS
jgi:hypothetical protein